MSDFVQPFQDWFRELVPNGPLAALLLVIASIVVGVLLVGLGRVILALTSRTRSELDDVVVKGLTRPVVTTVVLFGLWLAVDRFGLEDGTRRTTVRLLVTVGALVWFALGLRVSTQLLRYASENPDRFELVEHRTFPLFQNLVKVVVLGGAIYVLLLIWKVDATGWLASAGIVGIALGFAAKDTLSNLFAGVFIVADAPYRMGDYIVLDDGVRGKVVNIGLRSTRILTRGDIEITIPNAVIGSSKIVNQSGGGQTHMRVAIQVSVAYDADIDLARAVLFEIAEGEPNALDDPAPRVRFRRLGDSGLDFELLIWVGDPTLRGRTVDALNTQVIKRFRDAGLEIPYPKRDVYVYQR